MLTVYSTECCPKCQILKTYLKDNNVPFISKNLEDPKTLAELTYNYRLISVAPVIESNNRYLEPDQIFLTDNTISNTAIAFILESY